MKGSKTGELDPAHLAQWLKTTQRYLFAIEAMRPMERVFRSQPGSHATAHPGTQRTKATCCAS